MTMSKADELVTDKNKGQGGGKPDKPETFTFFVGREKYETDQPVLTGLQIKAKVPDWDPSHDLVLEGHGDDPDRVIRDDEQVSLAKVHGPLRFSSVPKANFGV
jgi:hypothetical protein